MLVRRYAMAHDPSKKILASALLSLALISAVRSQHDSSATPEKKVLRPLTVADSVEARRVLSFDGEPVKVSNDHRRFVALLVRGDLQRNGSWVEVWSGNLDGGIDGVAVKKIFELFTNSRGVSLPTAINRISWLADNERIALLWTEGRAPAQVTTINVKTGDVRTITDHPTDIVHFSVGRRDELVYTALPPRASQTAEQMLHDGFAISDSVRDAYEFLRGHVDGWRQWDRYETFIVSETYGHSRSVFVNGTDSDYWIRQLAEFSPNGRFVLLDGTAHVVPDDWSRYSDRFLQSQVASARADGAAPHQLRQLFIVDMHNGASRPLLSAPLSLRGRAIWSADSRHVFIGPTYLPVSQNDPSGLDGTAFAVVNIATSQVTPIALSETEVVGAVPKRWTQDGTIRLESKSDTFDYRQVRGLWRQVSKTKKLPQRGIGSDLLIEVRQSLNDPPMLVAKNQKTGLERTLLDVSPHIRSDVSLGRVEEVSWRDAAARTWHGVLYYPVNYSAGRTYPLVIQTHGYSPGEFSLLGKETITSAYAAQSLANHGIAVLQMEDKMKDVLTTPCEPFIHSEAYPSAVEHFASRGIVDATRVGLVGFSRSGWHVEYAITHSVFPYAAAIAVDNIDGSYLQALLRYDVRAEFELNNGAPPVGNGLRLWKQRAPGFNADMVKTPLRMQQDAGGLPYVLSQWELFTQLRDLRKPVELYVVPDIEHGTHGLVIPRQQLASRTGTVDWMNFWLNGREDTSVGKAEQYARWRRLRELRDVDHQRPQSFSSAEDVRDQNQQEASLRVACGSLALD